MTSTTDSKTSSKKTKDKHPLDDRVASGWPANPSGRTFDLPANNYHRDVYSDLITLISDEERISEKDFARLDTVMRDADKLVRDNEPIIVHCKKEKKRSNYCAELIWSQKMGREPFTMTESAYGRDRLAKLRARRGDNLGDTIDLDEYLPPVTTTAGHGIPQDDDDAEINAACGEPVAPPIKDKLGGNYCCPKCGCTWHTKICGHCGGENELCSESLKKLLPLIEQKKVTIDDFNAFISESLPKATHERIMRHTRMTGLTPRHKTPANKVDDKTDHEPGRHNDPTSTARGKRTVATQGKRNKQNARKFKPGGAFGEAVDFIRTNHGKAITEAELNSIADHIALYRLTTRLLSTPSDLNKDWLFGVHRLLTEKIDWKNLGRSAAMTAALIGSTDAYGAKPHHSNNAPKHYPRMSMKQQAKAADKVKQKKIEQIKKSQIPFKFDSKIVLLKDNWLYVRAVMPSEDVKDMDDGELFEHAAAITNDMAFEYLFNHKYLDFGKDAQLEDVPEADRSLDERTLGSCKGNPPENIEMLDGARAVVKSATVGDKKSVLVAYYIGNDKLSYGTPDTDLALGVN